MFHLSCGCVCAQARVTVRVWRSEDNLQELFLFLHHCPTSPGLGIELRLGGRCPSTAAPSYQSNPLYSERFFQSGWGCSPVGVFLHLLPSWLFRLFFSATPTPSSRILALEILETLIFSAWQWCVCRVGLSGEALWKLSSNKWTMSRFHQT